MPLWVYTRELKTSRINAVPGLPVESRLNSPHGRKFLRERFGSDVIAEVDVRRPGNFLALIGGETDSDLKDKFTKLRLLADEQAKTIRSLEHDIEGLKKQSRRQVEVK